MAESRRSFQLNSGSPGSRLQLLTKPMSNPELLMLHITEYCNDHPYETLLQILRQEIMKHFRFEPLCLHATLSECLFRVIYNQTLPVGHIYRWDDDKFSDIFNSCGSQCQIEDSKEGVNPPFATRVMNAILSGVTINTGSVDTDFSKKVAKKFGFVRNNEMDTLLHCEGIVPTVAEVILTEVGLDVDTCSIRLWTPLHSAVKACNTEVVRLYIENGADVNARDINFKQPLHYATTGEIVRLLCKPNNADPFARTNTGHTLLHESEFNKDVTFYSAVQEVAVGTSGTRIGNCLDLCGNTPLHSVTDMKTFSAVLSRMSQTEDSNFGVAQIRNFFNQTHLIAIAHSQRHYPLDKSVASHLLKLIQKYEYDIDDQDVFGNSCLHYCFQRATAEGLQILASKIEAVHLKIRNNLGMTPVGAMIRKNIPPSLYAILHRIPNIFVSFEDQLNEEIITGFGFDQREPDPHTTNKIDDYSEAFNRFGIANSLSKKLGERLNQQDADGRTLLHYSVFCYLASGTDECTLLEIVEAGANVDIVDKRGWSPRDLLAVLGENELVSDTKPSEKNTCNFTRSTNSVSENTYGSKDEGHKCKNKSIFVLNQNIAEVQQGIQEKFQHFVDIDFSKEASVHQATMAFDFNRKEFLDTLEQTWDQSKKSRHEVHPAVSKLRESLVSYLKEILRLVAVDDDRFWSSLVRVGSSFEGTQHAFSNEFDFTLSLDRVTEDFEIVSCKELAAALMLRLKPHSNLNIVNKWKEFLDDDDNLVSRQLVMKHHALVLKALSDERIRTQFPFIVVRDRSEYAFRPAIILEILALPESLTITGNDTTHFLKTLISVDLVSAISLTPWWPIEIEENFKRYSEVPLYAVVPRYWNEICTDSTNAYLRYFRICFAALESEILRTAPAVCRDALARAKLLSRKEKQSFPVPFGSEQTDVYRSYELKMSLFHNLTDEQLQQCKHALDNNWENTVFWCGKIFTTLFNFADDDAVPNCFIRSYKTRLWACEEQLGYSRNLSEKLGLDKYANGPHPVPLGMYHCDSRPTLLYVRDTIVRALALTRCFSDEEQPQLLIPKWVDNLIKYIDLLFPYILD